MRHRQSDSAPGTSASASLRSITRRHFFEQASFGIGGLALASLVDSAVLAAPSSQAAAASAAGRALDFPARAKRVIYLFMAGAPSQLDLFDPKPALTRHDGQDIPEELIKGERFAFIKGTPKLLASPFRFAQHGQSGAQVSELLPYLSKVVDDITIVRSMRTTQFNHAPAQIFMNTGHQVIGRPSFGSWLSYGLGSESHGPARLRRPAVGREQSRRRQIMLGERLPADAASGGRIPVGRRSGAVRLESGAASMPGSGTVRLRPSTISTASTSAIRKPKHGLPPTSSPTACRPAFRS